MTKWVQHISGQGDKWEVAHEYTHVWLVQFYKSDHVPDYISLPRSEYRECHVPEVWKDVTAHVIESECVGNWKHEHRDILGVNETMGYRLRKVLGRSNTEWAFIIERKEEP